MCGFFVILCVISCAFPNARNLKNRAPACTGAQFLQNCIFRARWKKTLKVDKKRHGFWCELGVRHMLKIMWKIDGFWGQKTKKSWKNQFEKHVFFECVLKLIYEGFWTGFGTVLGEVWDLLGVSWGTFSPLFLRLCCQEGPRGGQEAS